MTVILVFVHGWSVTNLDTYGDLPFRLQQEGKANTLTIDVREIFLGRYISFHDEVRIPDVAAAFDAAVYEQLPDVLAAGSRFVCITHSTGGPLIRHWWQKFYGTPASHCPMSHLIMLAPANFGSALAQLGKEKIGRLKSWMGGVEPGQGILDWLELASVEAWSLNVDWIRSDGSQISENGVFPFVLTGEYIDRKFYDHLNSYTGEIGSDGVVRVAAANLESRYLRLTQAEVAGAPAAEFEISEFTPSPATPLKVILNKSHSGKDMGIMLSVKMDSTDVESASTIKTIFDCIGVKDKNDYAAIYLQFANQTKSVQEQEKIEVEQSIFLTDRFFIHDRYAMVIFRVVDSAGFPITDYDLILTAGDDNDPNHLPKGFFADRQQNSLHHENVTYFFNYDIMRGTDSVMAQDGKILRSPISGISKLGLQVNPRPDKGFVRYQPCQIAATTEIFEKALQPNSTTLVEIVMHRLIDKEVFRLQKPAGTDTAFDFQAIVPGGNLVA